jgi:transketolase
MLTVERELQMALEDLAISEDHAASELDKEWQSAKKKQSYSKPSPGLLNLRHMAKKLIRAKLFEEVKKVAALIEQKQAEETALAVKRMSAGYQQADRQLRDKYELERSVLISTHQMKFHNLVRTREQNLKPINQRIQNLERLLGNAATLARQCEAKMMAATMACAPQKTSRRAQMTIAEASAQLPALMGAPKLAVPSVPRIKRGEVPPKGQQQQQAAQKGVMRPSSRQRSSASSRNTENLPHPAAV